jgi:glycosyltransferase involved in cell wall biosynthesis
MDAFQLSPADHVFVIIPMYRVEAQIQRVIGSIPAWVEGIIAVDDASPDESARKAMETCDPRLTLVRHTANRGVGGAMLSGYNRAIELGATVLVKMDGDGQMPAEHLPEMIRPILLGQADYAKGNRFVLYDALLSMPFIRRIGNLGLSFLTKISSGYWNIFDPTNGYTAIASPAFLRIHQQHIHPRYFFESSMLIELNLQRAVVVDVSLPARYDEETSSLSIKKTLVQFPPLLWHGLLRRVWLQYYVMDFTLASLYLVIGMLMVAWGLVWGLAKWAESISTGIAATTGTVMLAAIPFILGAQLLLQAIAYDMQNVPRIPISSRRTG